VKRTLLPASILMVLTALSPIFAGAGGMQDDIDRAASMLEQLQAGSNPTIPKQVMQNAKGLALLTVFELAPQLRTGLQLSGRGSKGVVVARTGSSWSAPSALASGSAGYGAQMKETLAELILVLNTNEALRSFASGENVYLGAAVTLAPGPKHVIVGSTPSAAVYYYGLGGDPAAPNPLGGVVIAANNEENMRYYGSDVSAQMILAGQVTFPAGARRLRKVLTGR
jgi:SH3 domain-containing YSC84-like protein 1